MGWSSKITRRNNFYAWNTINRHVATTVAGTPYGSAICHQSPFNLVRVSEEIFSVLYDPPLKRLQKWREEGPPAKSCCMGFNLLIIMLFTTFIQALPIIFRKHGDSIQAHPEHILNHASVKRLRADPGYQEFARLQLAAYDAALARPRSAEQATLDTLMETAGSIAVKVDSLISTSASAQQQQFANHREVHSLLQQILVAVQPNGASESAESRQDTMSSASAATSTSVRLPGPATVSYMPAQPESVYFSRSMKANDLREYQHAVHYFKSLAMLDKPDVSGLRHGCVELVKIVQSGHVQPDGLTRYPSLLSLDEAWGDSWTHRIKPPSDWKGVLNTDIKATAIKYRSIHKFIEGKVPYGASGTKLEKALNAANIIDMSREKTFTLSQWWDAQSAIMAQKKKTDALYKTVQENSVLTVSEKSQVIDLLASVTRLTASASVLMQPQLKASKEEGSRAQHPSLLAFNKAKAKYNELLSKKQPTIEGITLHSFENNQLSFRSSIIKFLY
jgi:hypothetical protein